MDLVQTDRVGDFASVVGKVIRDAYLPYSPRVYNSQHSSRSIVLVLHMEDDTYYAFTADLADAHDTRVDLVRAQNLQDMIGKPLTRAYDWSNDKIKGDIYKAEAYISFEVGKENFSVSAGVYVPITWEGHNAEHDAIHCELNLYTLTRDEFEVAKETQSLTSIKERQISKSYIWSLL